ncbi:MAG: DNA-processing protein DprA [Bacteroidota bacterium]|nr:DNA-processing protein DprA [Bacteroidota bacterium]MDP4211962.1 DNA-processing protein DprA [Bacteroidota bacterium]MDP4250080.1 DNA-processing protein DprA [Bacteroidota bacterium]
MPNDPDLVHLISLTRVPQVGCIHAKILLQHFGTAEAVFKAPVSLLEKLEGIGRIRAQSIRSFRDFSRSEKEIHFLERYRISALTMSDAAYPQRLLLCYDAPVLLYYKGSADLNQPKVISIVGTRRYSEYGKQITEKLIRDITLHRVLVVSGLAFGIDAIAHKTALRQSLQTVGVLAHGLSTLYPPEHTLLSKDMTKQGGLLTEFMSDIKPDKHHFPIRNRIVAGMSDATVVTETGVKGGSMITADLANGYHKEVFTFPGRTTDLKSAGCHWLIRNNQASLISNGQELIKGMGWEEKKTAAKADQQDLFMTLNSHEQRIVNLLKERESMHIEVINAISGFTASEHAAALLSLEMKDIIYSLPGRIYKLKS